MFELHYLAFLQSFLVMDIVSAASQDSILREVDQMVPHHSFRRQSCEEANGYKTRVLRPRDKRGMVRNILGASLQRATKKQVFAKLQLCCSERGREECTHAAMPLGTGCPSKVTSRR